MASNDSAAMTAVQKWMFYGVPIMFVIGSLTHFAFKLSGNNPIVAVFVPTNESVWEHLKMSFWMPLLWWIIGYLALSKKYDISACAWFTACAVMLCFNIVFITSFYYTYTGAFGISSVLIDILSVLLSLILGHILALHIYRYTKRRGVCILPFIVIALLAAAFAVFTFYPPQIPLFYDFSAGHYGIA